MNVKDLIDRWAYDGTVQIFFNINNKMYSYFEVRADHTLWNIEVNNIKATFKTMELTQEDIIIETNKDIEVDLILPVNSHYYMIIINIK
jgi:hypothetical protein